ncbi:hypothetical protein IEQ34_010183 [Dendrobium chrysotoxum]|uniref:Uncharacterized protein n=1 Tax=Dendrobium chrysotoxum TaxID=161865 RepID=A0AAV7H510_DENCH|nr:hypothetical protein IEQ34_010183 [Dendrobium chrysotoxum]
MNKFWKKADSWYIEKLRYDKFERVAKLLTHATRFCAPAPLELSMAFFPVIISNSTTPKL